MFFPERIRRLSISSAATSSTTGENTNMDSCCTSQDVPVATAVQPQRSFDHSRRQSSACSSEKSCESLSNEETTHLWQCMLELQERYGCYNSRRIDLAMGAGDQAVNLMPNRFIIDTLNDSLVDLPEEGREMLDRCLRHESQSPQEKPRRKFWKKE